MGSESDEYDSLTIFAGGLNSSLPCLCLYGITGLQTWQKKSRLHVNISIQFTSDVWVETVGSNQVGSQSGKSRLDCILNYFPQSAKVLRFGTSKKTKSFCKYSLTWVCLHAWVFHSVTSAHSCDCCLLLSTLPPSPPFFFLNMSVTSHAFPPFIWAEMRVT